MRKTAQHLAMVLLAASLGAAGGCGGESGPECGAGTTEQGGTCVPEITECAAGTVAQDGACVPACPEGQHWDGSACADDAACGPGTVEQGGQCVPACDEGEYWDGTECAAVPECADGTRFNAETGECEPDETACGEGTHLEDGACLPDVTCGPGTHLEGDDCVPDALPDPDVEESAEPTGLAEFTLPAPGASLVLGGMVDTPTDLNGDQLPDPDWDGFVFDAPAGTWLRLTAGSAGAALPAFYVISAASDDTGASLYVRYCANPRGAVATREVYLPYASEYQIAVSDYDHLISAAFGAQVFPVGGPEFTYRVTVENLGAPTPTPLAARPAEESGALDSGQLAFYSLTGLARHDVLEARSLGQPVAGTFNDLFAALLLLTPDGQVARHVSAGRASDDTGFLYAAPVDGDYLLVQDFLLTLGPDRGFALQVREATATDCNGADCSAASLAADEVPLLYWDLVPGDVFVAGVYLDEEEAEQTLNVTLLDATLDPLTDPTFATRYGNGKAFHFATAATRLYLHLAERVGEPIPEGYTVDARVVATPALDSGVALADQPIVEMPAGTQPHAGLAHVAGAAGEVVVLEGLATSPDWTDPLAELLTAELALVGPALDVRAGDFPTALATPLVARLPAAGLYLVRVRDLGDEEFTAGTFGVTPAVLVPVAADAPDAGAPATLAGQALDAAGVAVFSVELDAGQRVDLTVDPGAGAAWQPEVWALGPGKSEYADGRHTWLADRAEPRLGALARGAAAAAGEVAGAALHVPGDGDSLVLVRATGAGATGGETFDLTLALAEPPANDTCAAPTGLDLSGGAAAVSDTLAGATSDLDLGQGNACTGGFTSGPDRFYALDLAAGETVTATLIPVRDFDAVLYLFTDCAAAALSCVASADVSAAEVLEHTVAAGAEGTYLLAVDSPRPFAFDAYDLEVSIAP